MSTLRLIDPKIIDSVELSNQQYDEALNLDTNSSLTVELDNNIYSTESDEISEQYKLSLPKPPTKNNIKKPSLAPVLKDDKFQYINEPFTRMMVSNAWQAINQTDTWDFIAMDIETFMFPNDNRAKKIIDKMEELGYTGHSGSSFGLTLRHMQFLFKYGEEKFKKVFTR